MIRLKTKQTIYMKKIIISLLIAGAAIAANAQDKALLETLVKKGMLTQQEAAQIAKESVAVTPCTKTTKSIKLFGGGRGYYEWSQASVRNPSDAPSQAQKSGFELKHIKLGVKADVGAGWSATVITDFGTEGADLNYIDKAVASKKIDLDYINGTLEFGLRKVNMGYEQTTCDFGLLTIDRSVATYFFTRGNAYDDVERNFGSRTTGVFWDGNITQVDGLYYGVSVVSGTAQVDNAVNDLISGVSDSNSLSFFVNAGYKNVADVKGETISYDAGINFGYAPRGAKAFNGQEGSIWGINPYATLNWRGLTTIAEFFFQQVEDYANNDGITRSPLGANLTVAYKMDIGEWGAIEPVARFSFIASNGLGVSPLSQRYDDNNLFNDNYAFDNAMTVFAGVNWYITPAIKTSLGYEYGYYYDSVDNSDKVGYRAYDNTIRAQVQVLF